MMRPEVAIAFWSSRRRRRDLLGRKSAGRGAAAVGSFRNKAVILHDE
jgi:hypothetical protein